MPDVLGSIMRTLDYRPERDDPPPSPNDYMGIRGLQDLVYRSRPGMTLEQSQRADAEESWRDWIHGERNMGPPQLDLLASVGRPLAGFSLVDAIAGLLAPEKATTPAYNIVDFMNLKEQLGRTPRMDERHLLGDPEMIAPLSYLAGQIAGTNVAGGAPGPRFGSLAQYRTPMRLGSIKPGLYSEGEQLARYDFRNVLGKAPMRGQADMTLKPAEGVAHIDFLGVRNPLESAAARPAGHLGVPPEDFKDLVGRLVEELTNAGYSRIVTEPASKSRLRLFNRVAKQLEKEGKLPKGVKFEQSQPITDWDSPAIRNARARRLGTITTQEMDQYADNMAADEFLRNLMDDGWVQQTLEVLSR